MQPLAVALANYNSAVAATNENPFSAVVLALPPVILFVIFQRYFVESETSTGVKE